MNNPRNKAGFSLLEVMVAVAILAVITLMLGRVFSATTTAIGLGKERVMLDKAARVILDHFEEDIAQALVRTNVAFRTYDYDTENENSMLYFVSASNNNIYRTFGPCRFRINVDTYLATRTDLFQNWNMFFRKNYPDTSDQYVTNTVLNIIRLSDIYYDQKYTRRKDWKTVRPFGPSNATITKGWTIPANGEDYTLPIGIERRPSESVQQLQTSIRDTACLSFVFYAINGRATSNKSEGSKNTGIDPGKAPFGLWWDAEDLSKYMPKFVDITLGLISAKNLEMAMRIRAGGDQPRAEEYIDNNQKIYTRRVHMRNRAVGLQ